MTDSPAPASAHGHDDHAAPAGSSPTTMTPGQTAIVTAAGIEAILYSVVIFCAYLPMGSLFVPDTHRGVEAGIVSTATLLGALWALSHVHVIIQRQLEGNHPPRSASALFKVFDVVTSFLPVAALGVAVLYASGSEYVGWWKWVRTVIAAGVLLSVWGDFASAKRYLWDGK